MRHLSIALAIGAIAVITAACSATGGASGAPAGGTGGTIEGVNWRLTQLPSRARWPMSRRASSRTRGSPWAG